MEPLAIEGWPATNLAWRQKMAAFWSILWPSATASLLVMLAVTAAFPLDRLDLEAPRFRFASSILSVFCQVFFVPRLVRKKYSTFRVGVLRDGTISSAALSISEAVQVALRIIWPQAAVIALEVLVQVWFSGGPHRSAIRFVSPICYLARFFVVGPYALSFALRGDYRGFRLETYGQRDI
jgi:hypothetical protein